MANISFANLDQQFSFVVDHYAVYKGSTLEASNLQFWSWVTKHNHDVEFSGTDLAFDAGDLPISGTLTQLALDLNNDGLAPELAITDLSVAAKDLGPLVNGGLTEEQQENLFWRVLLAGNDEIDFTTYARNDPIDFAADGRYAESGQTLFGGEDTITGNTGTDAFIAGDYFDVNAGASAHGGDDVMNVGGSLFLGDFVGVYGFASGGNDSITIDAGKSFNTLSGDAHTVVAGGILAGGDDTLNVSGTSLGGTVNGDAPFVYGQLVGGDDTITNGDQGTVMMGDADKVFATGVLRGGHDVIKGGGGADLIFGDWREIVAGGKAIGGNDQLFGEAGDDTLNGNGGNDRLEGGADKDQHFGGDGNDTLVISAVTDVFVGEAYDGGLGKDTLLLSITGSYGLGLDAVTLKDIEALTFADPGVNKAAGALLAAAQIGSGLASDATITGSSFEDVTNTLEILFGAVHGDLDLSKLTMVNFGEAKDSVVIAGNAEQNTITGTSVNDIINGGGGKDTINGGGGNDTITAAGDGGTYDGGADDDLMLSGFGDETMIGGDGIDTIDHRVYDDDAYIFDMVTGQTQFINESYLGFENVIMGNGTNDVKGTDDANTMTGGTGKDTFDGRGGDDTLNGGKGVDRLTGGSGNDIYIVDNLSDVIVETTGEGTADRVRAAAGFALAADDHIELMETVDAKAVTTINLKGNALKQSITGNAGANRLDDGGGAGKDTLTGFGGDDTYVIGNSGAVIAEASGGGTDTVITSVDYVLKAGVEVEVLRAVSATSIASIDLTGNAFVQTIIGNAGKNILSDGGSASADTLQGLGGDDTYRINNSGAIIAEVAGGGNDTVYAAVNYTLKAGIAVEVLRTALDTGTAAIELTGNALAQTLIGNAGSNVLNDGGGTGIDTLQGLGGSDTYRIGNSAAIIAEGAGGGTDTVFASVSYTLGSGVEVETLRTSLDSGTTAISLTGNALAQSIIGNAGANVLSDGGGAGVDKLTGLGGSDTYQVGNSGAVIVEAAGGGTDTVITSVDYKLKAGVEVEVLRAVSATSVASIDLTGNEFAQTLTANAGSNILDGKGGTDKLTGLGGKDFFVFSSAPDAGNVDTVTDFNVADDTIRLENAIFSKLTATGTLDAALFRASSAGTAADANDFVLYDTDDGKLYYDADGSGSGLRVHFATLTGAPAVTAGDFEVI